MVKIFLNFFKNIYSFFFALILVFSCGESNTEDLEINAQEEETVQLQLNAQNAIEGISVLAGDLYELDAVALDNDQLLDKGTEFLDCGTLYTEIMQSGRKVIRDFEKNCTTKQGFLVSGKIISVITVDPVNFTANIRHTFEDFYLEGNKIEGTLEVMKLFVNAYGNPQANKTFDLSIYKKDGTVVSMKGKQEREWIEGLATRDHADDVFLINGSYAITDQKGGVYTHRTKEPLRRELSCKHIVKGTVEFVKESRTIVLDFGNGECDALATIEINGKLREIVLRDKY